MEKRVETGGSEPPRAERALSVRLLGPLTIERAGIPLPLPASRKVRALLAYLALAPQAVTRSRLCELLWDIPNDPRGELRWCLSKLRSVLDEPGRRRVQTSGETVRLDLTDCFVDAVEIGRATQHGVETIPLERLAALHALYAGDVLAGLELEARLQFSGWLAAQRRRFRGYDAALLEGLARNVPDADALHYLELWLELAPYDSRVHERLLNALACSGRLGDGEAHFTATVRSFDDEGLDSSPIRDAWRGAKALVKGSPVFATGAPFATGVPFATNYAACATPVPNEPGDVATISRRASVAVMPFLDRAAAGSASDTFTRGLAHDVITRLAKLRSLFVIAQGSVFALHEQRVGPSEAGRALNVDYVVSGSIERRHADIAVTVELAEARTARIVWTEDYCEPPERAFEVLDEIGNRIVASIASEIEANERNRAILKPPNSLDAWEAHHRGLWHMYRFNRADNDLARHFFEMAVRLDPTFARAYAGLSFTHFQNVFQGWGRSEHESERAFESAGQSLITDDHDPAAHWAMGRALWLRGRLDQSLDELERSVDLSPNFALAHYTLAFVQSQSGDPRAAINSSDHSRHLSPFDPLLFGMLASRAMALVRLGQFDEAAEWAVKAAARPNAHAHIRAIAACSLALAKRPDEGGALVAAIRKTLPRYGIDDFLAAFRFSDDGVALFRKGAKRIGMT